MKILLTSDLHRDAGKLLWLQEEAPEHDALLVAGDLLNIYSNTGLIDQKSGILCWRDTVLKSGKSFAWCSGNHDFFNGDHTPMADASPLWMREHPSTETCVTDGESRLLETPEGGLAVTTLPWPVHGGDLVVDGYRTSYLDFVKKLLKAGRKIKDEEGVPWIVLNHEPPGGTPLSATYFAPEADFTRRIINAAEPDFSLHGHIHQAPTSPGGFWIFQLGPTVCLNAGQSQPGEPPHHILLEWRGPREWTAIWRGAGRTLRAECNGSLRV